MSLQTLSATSLSRAIAAADKRHSALVNKMIADGRGYETPREIMSKLDDLSRQYTEHASLCTDLYAEKRARMEYHGSYRPIKRAA